VHLVIDALDEREEKSLAELFSIIKPLLSSGKMKLLVTSRFLPEIKDRFKSNPCIEIRASDSDVEKYATSRLAELSSRVRKNVELSVQIVEAGHVSCLPLYHSLDFILLLISEVGK
jgi:hypothetical protein